MPCTCPLDAYPAPPGSDSRKLVWSPHQSYAGARPIRVPCGRCMGCRLDRSQDWSTRIIHEAQCHESSVFVTPTYSNEHLPSDLSVSIREHQLFVKRVRAWAGIPLRFFGVGEYGGRLQRPHYHTILFGVDFPDKWAWSRTPVGNVLYRSERLEKLWPFGQCLFGAVTPQAAAYVARYTTKKFNGALAVTAYNRTRVDPDTGEERSWQVKPEFAVMSRRPGIGTEWFQRYAGDAFPSDFLIIDGQKRRVPNFYKAKLSDAEAQAITVARKANARRHADNNTESRLMVRHESQILRAEQLRRSLEEEL